MTSYMVPSMPVVPNFTPYSHSRPSRSNYRGENHGRRFRPYERNERFVINRVPYNGNYKNNYTDNKQRKCWTCEQTGHISRNCPKKSNQNANLNLE